MIAVHLITDKVATVEVIWTAVCLTGLLLTARPLRYSLRQRALLNETKVNGIKDYAASTTVLLFSVIETMLFIFTLAGLFAMLIAPANPGEIPTGTYVVAGLLITGAFIVTLAGYIVDKRQHELEKKIIEEELG